MFKEEEKNELNIQNKIDHIMKSEHNLVGKKALIPRISLKSHFDVIRELAFCAND